MQQPPATPQDAIDNVLVPPAEKGGWRSWRLAAPGGRRCGDRGRRPHPDRRSVAVPAAHPRDDRHLRPAGDRPQHRRGPRRAARSGLRGLLRPGRIHLCDGRVRALQHPLSLRRGARAVDRRRGHGRRAAGHSGPPAARRLPRHRDPRVRRDRLSGAAQPGPPDQHHRRSRRHPRGRPRRPFLFHGQLAASPTTT